MHAAMRPVLNRTDAMSVIVIIGGTVVDRYHRIGQQDAPALHSMVHRFARDLKGVRIWRLAVTRGVSGKS